MSAKPPNLGSRIASLSPAKRELLKLLNRAGSAQEDAAGHAGAPRQPRPILTEDFPEIDDEHPDKSALRRFYNAVNQQLDASPFREFSLFLNYGYVPNGNRRHARFEPPENFPGRNATRLILEVIGDCELGSEQAVLDVGCGRGGTVTVLHRFFGVRRLVALDLAPSAVFFSAHAHRALGCRFLNADAEAVPLAGASFDAVTSIESSHGYPDVFAFFREVERLLRPGGHFLYTDLIATERIDGYQDFLIYRGLTLERKQEITSNVLLSCDETAATNARAFGHDNDAPFLERFVAVPDSRVYNEMKNGERKYLLYRFRKVGTPGGESP